MYQLLNSQDKNEGGPGHKFMRFGGHDLETFGNLRAPDFNQTAVQKFI